MSTGSVRFINSHARFGKCVHSLSGRLVFTEAVSIASERQRRVQEAIARFSPHASLKPEGLPI